MNEVFADTAFWLALLIRRDQWHESAIRAYNQLHGRQIVTTEMVLIELLDSVSSYGPRHRERAVIFIRALHNNRRADIVAYTAERFWAAVDFYQSRLDQRWGLTDCASFIVMRERNITDALTSDRDFTQAGFTILMQ